METADLGTEFLAAQHARRSPKFRTSGRVLESYWRHRFARGRASDAVTGDFK
jgi:hypothetical protein